VVLAVVWAHSIITCTRVPAGEVDRGTIDVLLGLPVSRWGLVVSETAVWLAGVAAILALAVLGHLIGSRNVAADLRPELARVLIVIANLGCLSFAVGAAAWLASSLSDRRGRAITTVFVIMVASFLVNYLAQLWQPAQRIAFLGVLRYYRPLMILRDGAWPVTDMAVLLCVGGACWAAAGVIFARRDLNTV
jgi:ABC-type transport system involved in multi-copper enzyme maturation permease subunit